MRILQKVKDGGDSSTVDAFVLCEFKSLFSIILLRFNKGSRSNFHSHAFNAWTWFLFGNMDEHNLDGDVNPYKRSWIPKLTRRYNVHKVVAKQVSWCFTIRGPWEKTWLEVTPEGKMITLANGRIVVKEESCLY